MPYVVLGEQEGTALTSGSPSGVSDDTSGLDSGLFTSPLPGLVGLADAAGTTPWYRSTTFWGNVVAIAAVLVFWHVATKGK
jgi:hypothetical protein